MLALLAPGPDIPEIELKLKCSPSSIPFDRENEVVSRLLSQEGVSSMRDRQAPIISMKNTLSQNEQRWPAGWLTALAGRLPGWL